MQPPDRKRVISNSKIKPLLCLYYVFSFDVALNYNIGWNSSDRCCTWMAYPRCGRAGAFCNYYTKRNLCRRLHKHTARSPSVLTLYGLLGISCHLWTTFHSPCTSISRCSLGNFSYTFSHAFASTWPGWTRYILCRFGLESKRENSASDGFILHYWFTHNKVYIQVLAIFWYNWSSQQQNDRVAAICDFDRKAQNKVRLSGRIPLKIHRIIINSRLF